MLPKEPYDNWRLYVILKDNLILPKIHDFNKHEFLESSNINGKY